MAGFTIIGFQTPGTNLAGIQIIGSGQSPSTKVKISLTADNAQANYAYNASYGTSPQLGAYSVGSGNEKVSTWQFMPYNLPLFQIIQFINPNGDPLNATGYDSFEPVPGQPSQMRLKSSSYPTGNITITVIDGGSGGPPMA